NKIWNAGRFVFLKVQEKNEETFLSKKERGKIKSFKNKVLKDLKKHFLLLERKLEDLDFGSAAEIVYRFFWHRFCDLYLEKYKKLAQIKENKEFLLNIFKKILVFLHPFLPFITEALYQKLPLSKKDSIALEDWPNF
ncbi:MAG: class I tRNA ligase family protein, partial [Minisyncoccales bacterium]